VIGKAYKYYGEGKIDAKKEETVQATNVADKEAKMIYRKDQRLSLKPDDAVDEAENIILAEIENKIRLDEQFNERSIADAEWDNDQTFFLRAMNDFSDNLLSNSEWYQAEASRILHSLQKRNKKTRVWLTGKLEALAKEFPEYDDN